MCLHSILKTNHPLSNCKQESCGLRLPDSQFKRFIFLNHIPGFIVSLESRVCEIKLNIPGFQPTVYGYIWERIPYRFQPKDTKNLAIKKSLSKDLLDVQTELFQGKPPTEHFYSSDYNFSQDYNSSLCILFSDVVIFCHLSTQKTNVEQI